MTKLQAQVDSLTEAKSALEGREQDLKMLLDAHEATNRSLQFQLSSDEGRFEVRSEGQHSCRSDSFLTTDSGHETIKRLQLELRLANALKDEYKSRLNEEK